MNTNKIKDARIVRGAEIYEKKRLKTLSCPKINRVDLVHTCYSFRLTLVEQRTY